MKKIISIMSMILISIMCLVGCTNNTTTNNTPTIDISQLDTTNIYNFTDEFEPMLQEKYNLGDTTYLEVDESTNFIIITTNITDSLSIQDAIDMRTLIANNEKGIADRIANIFNTTLEAYQSAGYDFNISYAVTNSQDSYLLNLMSNEKIDSSMVMDKAREMNDKETTSDSGEYAISIIEDIINPQLGQIFGEPTITVEGNTVTITYEGIDPIVEEQINNGTWSVMNYNRAYDILDEAVTEAMGEGYSVDMIILGSDGTVLYKL